MMEAFMEAKGSSEMCQFQGPQRPEHPELPLVYPLWLKGGTLWAAMLTSCHQSQPASHASAGSKRGCFFSASNRGILKAGDKLAAVFSRELDVEQTAMK